MFGVLQDFAEKCSDIAEFARAAHDPKFVVGLDSYGVEPLGLTPEEFTAFLKEGMALWAEAVKIAGVTLP